MAEMVLPLRLITSYALSQSKKHWSKTETTADERIAHFGAQVKDIQARVIQGRLCGLETHQAG